MIYSVFIIPFYNHYFKMYQHVLSIDSIPEDLDYLFYKYPKNTLSPFIPRDPNTCFYIFAHPRLSLKSIDYLFKPDDVPMLINILEEHQYNIIKSPVFDFSFSSSEKKHFIFSITKTPILV
jgi:hypothetical protein